MIKIHHLTKKFEGQTVLHHLDAEAREGEMIGIVGASGSGKSLFLKCLALKEKWDKGTLEYNGQIVRPSDPFSRIRFRMDCAYMQGESSLSPHRTAIKNVLQASFYQSSLWRKILRKPSLDEYLNAMDYLEKFGLLDLAHRKVATMSGGERQRVAIAKAIVHGAKIIVADNPAAGLDPHSSEAILQDFRQLCADQNITVFFSVPQLDWIQKYATRIIGMADGRIQFDVSGRRLTSQEKLKLGVE